MSTLGDKLLINLLQTLDGNLFTKALAANIKVLAENTVQIAAAEKNGATATGTANAGLLPHMQPCPSYDGLHATATATKIALAFSIRHILRSINTAAMRAYITISHLFHLLFPQ